GSTQPRCDPAAWVADPPRQVRVVGAAVQVVGQVVPGPVPVPQQPAFPDESGEPPLGHTDAQVWVQPRAQQPAGRGRGLALLTTEGWVVLGELIGTVMRSAGEPGCVGARRSRSVVHRLCGSGLQDLFL